MTATRLFPLALLLCLTAATAATAAPVGNLPDSGILGGTWVTNIPADQYLGLTIYRVIPRKVGWFIEGKFGRQMTYESSNYYENISIGQSEDWGDQFLKSDESYDTFNAGVTYAYGKQFFVYLGAGISETDSYRQYHDEFGILGDGGNYWIDGIENGTATNTVFGAMFRTSDTFVIQIGYDSRPAGLNLGIGLVTSWPSPY